MDRPGLTSRSDLDDLNSDAAAAYVLANARVSYEWEKGKLHLRAAARMDNLFDKRYVATVIVNEGNARYFKPAPGRAWADRYAGDRHGDAGRDAGRDCAGAN